MDKNSFLKKIWWKHSQLEFLSVGDEMYAVASSWLKKFRDSNASPGPIDNVTLECKNGRIKKELKEWRDFEFVSAFLWAQLTEMYGCKKSSLSSFYVRERGSRKFVELCPPIVDLFVFETKNSKEPSILFSNITASITETFQSFKSRIMKLSKTSGQDVRMWYDDTIQERSWKHFPTTTTTTTLEDLNIVTNCDHRLCILIETRNEKGTWRIENKNDKENKNDVDNKNDKKIEKTLTMRSCSVDSKEWRESLTKGSRVDFRFEKKIDREDSVDSKENWCEAIVVDADDSSLHVHCLGWLENSKLYRVRVSRDSTSLAPPHTKLRDWRKQLKKEARVDLHVKLFLNSTNAPYYRSLSRVQSFVSYPATSTQEVFYIHYVKTPNSNDVGEWWLGQRPEEAHGFMYFPTNSLNPLELKPRSETECWLYYDEHRGSFLADSTAHIEQVSLQDALNYSSSARDTPDCTDDIYPRFIRLVDHVGVQHLRCQEVYGRFFPTPDMGWVEAVVKRVDHRTGRLNLVYVTKNGTQGAIDDVDLYSEFISLHGTHIKKQRLETGYADSFRTGPSLFGPGLVGLRNMGNTCYMNSMLQCLSACEPLVEYMMKADKMKSEINLKNALGTGGEVANAFRRLISVVWSGKASEVVPRDFKTCFGVHNNKFAEYVIFLFL